MKKKCKLINADKSYNTLNSFEELLVWLNWIIKIANIKGINIYNKKDTREDEKLFKYREDN